ncbi:MAG: outer membrane protein [Xanthobacteraceae bacterium]
MTATIVGAANAADLGVRQPLYKGPPPPLAYYSWTGCYVGAHLGGLWAHKDWTYGVPVFRAAGGHDADGVLGGVQAGCNLQMAGPWVFGLQGDYAWTNASGSNADSAFPEFSDQSQIRSLGSVTARAGYAWDRFLGYVKGGGAWEHDNYAFLFGGVTTATASETRGGWTVGLGGEYAILPNLTGFIEYDYYNFGTRTLIFSDASVVDIKESKSVLKGGLNFKFGGSPPIAARY